MGCWKGTCMISQLPINYHDEVVVIPFERVPNANLPNNAMCYTDELYKPLPIVLKGLYNDYGSIEHINGDIQQLIDFVVNKSNRTIEEISSEYLEYTDVESCLTYIERNKLDGIGFAMIHADLFHRLIDVKQGKVFGIQSLSERIAKFANKYEENNIISIINSSEYKEYFSDTIIKNCKADSIFLIIILSKTMLDLRKFWMPQSGAGGQNGISETHFEFLNFYDNYITENEYEDDEY